MRIDFNRICKLAGINERSRSTRYLNESADSTDLDAENTELQHESEDGLYEEDDNSMAYEMSDMYNEEVEEKPAEEEEDESAKQDEVVDIDIRELMSEIRRAKKIIKINEIKARKNAQRKQRLKENKLKSVIAREVESVLSKIQENDSEWVYGKRSPRNSRQGFTAQGSTIPGIGFRKY
jgi:hypothetical protein